MQSNTAESEHAVNGEPKEKKENFFVESKKLLEQYVRDKILLVKLEISKTAATASAKIATGLLLAVFGLFALAFISITLGFVFSKLTGSYIWGFGIVSAIYIVLIIIAVASRKWVRKKIADGVISSIYSKSKESKEDGSDAAKN